jgi:ArsR family transcriptional regulator
LLHWQNFVLPAIETTTPQRHYTSYLFFTVPKLFFLKSHSTPHLYLKINEHPIPYNDADVARAARCLKAMSHPLRLKILCVLGSDAVSVQDIVKQVGTSQSNISQHLAILREKGILGYKKEANRVYYFIDDQRMLQLIRMMRDVFCCHH